MALKVPDLSEEFNLLATNLLLLTTFSVPEGVSKKVTLANLRAYTLPVKSEIDGLGVNAGTVGGNTVETPVPTGAVFTDTQDITSDLTVLPSGITGTVISNIIRVDQVDYDQMVTDGTLDANTYYVTQ